MNSIWVSLSSSFNQDLVFIEKLRDDLCIISERDFIISSVFSLFFSNSLQPQHFITVFEGHHILSSIPEKFS
jgi:hypothetical protein